MLVNLNQVLGKMWVIEEQIKSNYLTSRSLNSSEADKLNGYYKSLV